MRGCVNILRILRNIHTRVQDTIRAQARAGVRESTEEL